MIATPGQLNQRSEFYHQLGALVSAGITLPKALEMLQRTPPSRAYVQPIARILDLLREGASVDDAFMSVPGFTPDFDLALLQAGNKSGRLDVCLKLLSNHYRQRAQLVRQMIGDLLYPVFVVHFAVVLNPFIKFFQSGDLMGFIVQVLATLLPIYALAFFMVYASQGNRGLAWRSKLEAFVHCLPVLGSARRQLAISRLAAALESLLNAGVPILGGWQLAAAASGSPALAREVASWTVSLENGATPAEMVSRSRLFPEVFSSLYSTGEVTGTLDQTLQRLHVYFEEEGQRRMRTVAQWTPRLFYACVVVVVGYRVVVGWMAYFGQINQVLQM